MSRRSSMSGHGRSMSGHGSSMSGHGCASARQWVMALTAILAVGALVALLPSCSSEHSLENQAEKAKSASPSAAAGPRGADSAPSTAGAASSGAAKPSGTASGAGTASNIPGRKGPRGMIFDTDSPYGRVMVVDRKGVRCLMFADEGEQTCMDLSDPDYCVHEYVRLMVVGVLFVRPGPRTLMVGLGGGSLLRLLLPHVPALHIDAVELNPVVVQVAQDFFAVRPSERLALHVADGRKYLETSKERWDLILLDAYGEKDIPFPLTTVEFLNRTAAHLDGEGAVVANLWFTNDRLFRAMLRTYREVFPAMYVFKGLESGNAIVVGLRAKAPPTCEAIQDRAKRAADTYGFSFDPQISARRCRPIEQIALDDVPVLRDARESEFKALSAQ